MRVKFDKPHPDANTVSLIFNIEDGELEYIYSDIAKLVEFNDVDEASDLGKFGSQIAEEVGFSKCHES